MSTTASTAVTSEVARARSSAYALISYGFQYPDQDLVAALSAPARWTGWPKILERIVPETAAPLTAVQALLGHASSGGSDESNGSDNDTETHRSQWLAAYNVLFGHAVRGKCPSYELEYGRSEIIQQTSILADVAGFYSAFGMEVGPCAQDRADHVSVESEFMSFLCAKEAWAVEMENSEHRDVVTSAQRNFLRDHLACWLPAFAHRVMEADAQGWYGTLARFANVFVVAECQQFEILIGPQTLEINPADAVLDRTIDCVVEGDEGPRDSHQRFIQVAIESAPD